MNTERTLFHLLAELATDRDKLDQFTRDLEADPATAAKNYGISEEQARLLQNGRSGAPHDFFKAIGDEVAQRIKEFC